MVLSCFTPSGWNSQAILDGSFLGYGLGVGSSSEFTVSGMSFGEENTHRWLVATVVMIIGTGSIGSVTIGGVAATLVVQRTTTFGVQIDCSIYKALVPTGASGDVVVTGGLGTPAGSVGLYRFIANALGASLGTNAAMSVVAAQAGDYILSVAGGAGTGGGTTTSVTFSGTTDTYDQVLTATQATGGGAYPAVPVTASVSVGVTFNGTGFRGGTQAVASFRETF